VVRIIDDGQKLSN